MIITFYLRLIMVDDSSDLSVSVGVSCQKSEILHSSRQLIRPFPPRTSSRALHIHNNVWYE